MSKRVGEISKQLAVLIANTGTATREQIKVAKAHKRKLREQNQAVER